MLEGGAPVHAGRVHGTRGPQPVPAGPHRRDSLSQEHARQNAQVRLRSCTGDAAIAVITIIIIRCIELCYRHYQCYYYYNGSNFNAIVWKTFVYNILMQKLLVSTSFIQS